MSLVVLVIFCKQTDTSAHTDMGKSWSAFVFMGWWRYKWSLPHYVSVLFILQQTSNVSATLVLARPVKGPKHVVLDLEMVTVNNVINFRGSSIIRLKIYVSEHPFWRPPPHKEPAGRLVHDAAGVMVICFTFINVSSSSKVSVRISWWEGTAVLWSTPRFPGLSASLGLRSELRQVFIL